MSQDWRIEANPRSKRLSIQGLESHTCFVTLFRCQCPTRLEVDLCQLCAARCRELVPKRHHVCPGASSKHKWLQTLNSFILHVCISAKCNVRLTPWKQHTACEIFKVETKFPPNSTWLLLASLARLGRRFRGSISVPGFALLLVLLVLALLFLLRFATIGCVHRSLFEELL